MSSGITHVSDAERFLMAHLAAQNANLAKLADDAKALAVDLAALLPELARLEGEALVLRELLRRALDPLETIDRGEFESDEEFHLLCALRADISRTIAPTQVADVVQKGMF